MKYLVIYNNSDLWRRTCNSRAEAEVFIQQKQAEGLTETFEIQELSE